MIGELIGAEASAPITERVWAHPKHKIAGVVTREYRVRSCFPARPRPRGLLVYGWFAQYHTFWLVPDIGVAILVCDLMSATSAMQSYVIDVLPGPHGVRHRSSSFSRSVFGFVFPLFAPSMYSSPRYGLGNSLLALLAVVRWGLEDR